MNRRPTYFLSHGGGPWPWMGGPTRQQYEQLETSLHAIARELVTKPKAVLVVSGHWEEGRFTLQSGAHPGMIYDYSGFPPAMYHIRYPSPGAPEVARRAQELLTQAGLPAAADPERGYDHGTYTPLYAMYPHADVPVLELSLKWEYDPEEHLAAGRALAPLRDEDVLILASGLSWHNLRMMGPTAREPSQAFGAWLDETLAAPPGVRSGRLREWEQAPMARLAHPEEDHLLPLLVAVGAAESEAARRVYHEERFMGGVTASSYRFGEV